MKRKIIALIITLLIVGITIFIFFSLNNTLSQPDVETPTKTSILTLKDNMFVTTLNDIYINYQDYEGKTLSYEGFMFWEDDYRVVAREYYCCGYDPYVVGLECYSEEEFPAKDEWVKVEGVIKVNYDTPSYPSPYLDVTSIEVLETRGEEVVYF